MECFLIVFLKVDPIITNAQKEMYCVKQQIYFVFLIHWVKNK